MQQKLLYIHRKLLVNCLDNSQLQPIDKEKIMPGEVRQLSYRDQIKDLLGKIMNHEISDAEVKKKGREITIEVNTNEVGAIRIQHHLQQSDIKRDVAKAYIFEFTDSKNSVDYLHNKLLEGMTSRIIVDIEANSSGFSNPFLKKDVARFSLQAAKNAVNNLGHEETITDPIARHFIDELEKNFKGADEVTKKIYAHKVLDKVIEITGVRLDQSPKRS
ncbi:MAG: hypothetical protein AABY33_01680 [Pseudomonadota bacterium]